jgi:hypothetical protein
MFWAVLTAGGNELRGDKKTAAERRRTAAAQKKRRTSGRSVST